MSDSSGCALPPLLFQTCWPVNLWLELFFLPKLDWVKRSNCRSYWFLCFSDEVKEHIFCRVDCCDAWVIRCHFYGSACRLFQHCLNSKCVGVSSAWWLTPCPHLHPSLRCCLLFLLSIGDLMGVFLLEVIISNLHALCSLRHWARLRRIWWLEACWFLLFA